MAEPAPSGLTFARVELLQLTAPVSSTNALVLLPPSIKTKRSRLVVGCDDGVVTCLEVKKGVATVAFKTVVPDGRIECLAVNSGVAVGRAGPADASAPAAVPLGGAGAGAGAEKESKSSVYVSCGGYIRGFNCKKGKEFLRMQTGTAEAVRRLAVHDARVWTAGEFVVSTVDGGTELGSYICPDAVSAFALAHITRSPPTGDSAAAAEADIVLGCHDRYVRFVASRGGSLLAECGVEAPVTALAVVGALGEPAAPPGIAPPGCKLVIYGTATGVLGLLLASAAGVWRGWTVAPAGAATLGAAPAAITTITTCDMLARGAVDIVVGRDDGTLEVWSMEPRQDVASAPDVAAAAALLAQSQPTLLSAVSLEESVRCAVAGQVSTAGVNEIVVLTYSGRLLSYTTESMTAKDPEDREGRTKAVVQKEAQLVSLRKEVDDLRKTIEKAREKAAKDASKLVGGRQPTIAGPGAVAYPMAQYAVNSSFALDPSDGAYALTLELPATIDCVILQSSVPLDLVDGAEGSDGVSQANSAAAAAAASGDASGAAAALAASRATSSIMSVTPCDPRSGVAMLATFRCQEATSRVQLRMRTVEGQQGEIQAFVVNRVPPKSATLVRLPVKPLSLHHRLSQAPSTLEAHLAAQWHDFLAQRARDSGRATGAPDAEVAMSARAGGAGGSGAGMEPPPSFPWSTLNVTGGFSLSQMHEWVAGAVPGVPSRLTADGKEEVSLVFASVFLGSHLTAVYARGRATFRSDSPSAIAILREIVVNNATAVKLRIDTGFEVPPYALRHVMTLLHPKLHYALALARRAELVDAVREIAQTEGSGDVSFLQPEWADILANGDRYRRELKSRSRLLDRLYGVATDAFVDVHKFRGRDVTPRIGALIEMLARYDETPEQVLAFMDSGGTSA